MADETKDQTQLIASNILQLLGGHRTDEAIRAAIALAYVNGRRDEKLAHVMRYVRPQAVAA